MWRCPLSNVEDARASLEVAARGHGPQLIAALTRRFGSRHLQLIEDAVQTALVRGLERWPVTLPERADGWLLRVAGNQLIDALRSISRLDLCRRNAMVTRISPLRVLTTRLH